MVYSINEKLFKKEYVNIVKGVAIIMMFFHHFYNLSWIEGYSIFDISITRSIRLSGIISDSGKLCIALFALVTGYGIYVKYSPSNGKNNENDLKLLDFICNVIKKIFSVLVSYWGLFFVFCIPLYLFSGNPFPTLVEMMWGGVGLDSKLCTLNWYIFFFAVGYFLISLICYLNFRPKIDAVIFLLLLLFSLIWNVGAAYGILDNNWTAFEVFQRVFTFLPAMELGFLINKYDLFLKPYKVLTTNKSRRVIISISIIGIFVSLLSLEAVIILSKWRIFEQLDFLWGCVLLFFILAIIDQTYDRSNAITRILSYFGKKSFQLWILHGCFFGSFKKLQFLVYEFHLPVISAFVLLLIAIEIYEICFRGLEKWRIS